MRILITDDEVLEHEGLSRMIGEMPLQVTELLHAWNGKEALEIIRKENPEIVITDVRMPVMNGLELLKVINDDGRECEVLFISGYEDFHAVREAMLLGANNWIVKPVNREELYSTLCKMNVRKQRRDLSRHVDNEMTMLREKLLTFEQEEVVKRFLLRAPGEQERGEDVDLARKLHLLSAEGQYIVMTADITEIDKIYLSGAGLPELTAMVTGPVYMPGGGMALILFLPTLLDQHEIQSQAEDVSEKWKAYLEERCDTPVTIGVSMAGSCGQLPILYRQARDAQWERDIYGKGKVFFYYEDSPLMEVKDGRLSMEDWTRLLHQGDFNGLKAYIDSFLTLVERKQNLRDSRQFAVKLIHTTTVEAAVIPPWNVLIPDTLADIEAIYGAGTLPELLETLHRIFSRWWRAFGASSMGRNQEIVRDALTIIEEDIAGDLYAEAIAGKLYITASHLRRTFKNVMGITLQNYVLRVRMERAQELLRSTRVRISDIAQMVGYGNIPHFTMTFKAYTQMTPGDYRSRMSRKEPL